MKNVLFFFISAKAWKIFIIYSVLLIMVGFLYFSNLKSFVGNSLFYVTNDLFVLFWLYSVGCQLYSFIPPNKMNLKLFQVISLISFFLLLSFFFYPSAFCTSTTIILLNLAFAFLVFFVARLITIAEIDENGHINSCLGTFVYIWMFPIGIWLVQPRIIKIFKKNSGIWYLKAE